MEDEFFEISKQIANQFIQNIVFVDDKAYRDQGNDDTTSKNDFNASVISKRFSNEGKLCSIYSPENKQDIDKYKEVLHKADVVVLDWYLDVKDEEPNDPNADAETDEPRGEFTLELIDSLLDSKMLKLIIIYTGETDLKGITEDVYKKIEDKSPFKKDNFCISSNTLRILVKAKKQDTDKQFEHMPEYKGQIVSYDDFPNLIVEEFAKMTNGLLPNFALSSISALRRNTSRIINAFSSDLDPAYLGHKLLIGPSPDSKLLLTRIFGQAISELLETENINTDNWVEQWIDNHAEETDFDWGENKKIHVTNEILKKMLNSESNKITSKYSEASQGQKCPKEEFLKKHCTHMFIFDNTNAELVNAKFAILTHHKNIFKPLTESPTLSLGTIIKQQKEDEEKFYICVQQRCDSVRIKNGDERKFLFLPLLKEGKNTPLIIKENLTLFPSFTSYSLKTIKFGNPKDGCIKADKDEHGKFFFTSIYDDKYEWIVELKELHAQRIIDAYCSQLSRVGLNESEWLRLQESKKS